MSMATVARFKEILEKGNVFTKFHASTDSKAKRFVYYEGGVLYWCQEGTRGKSPKHSSPINCISRISTTKDTFQVYKSNTAAKNAPENLVLTLVFDNLGGKTLNLQAATTEIRDQWAKALNAVKEADAAAKNPVGPSSIPEGDEDDDDDEDFSRPKSKLEMAVLPNPMPPAMQAMVDMALTSITCSMKARIRQKLEDEQVTQKKLGSLRKLNDELYRKNKELEDHLAQSGEGGMASHSRVGELEAQLAQYQELEAKHELEWNSLAIQTSSDSRGKIEIRLATANLEHEPPHQYVGILYIKHPLEDQYEYSQTVSLMRSMDGSTYVPKLILSPTELFAFRHPDDEDDQLNDEGDDEDEDGQGNRRRSNKPPRDDNEAAPEGELVGAQLKIEVWDLINKRMYEEDGTRTPRSARSRAGDDEAELEQDGYQGHVEFDMNELIAATHHVLSLPITNSLSPAKEAMWADQNVNIVMQYCLPVPDEQDEEDGEEEKDDEASQAKKASTRSLANGSTDPLLTLRLKQLEEDYVALNKTHTEFLEDYNVYKQQAEQFQEEHKIRVALEQRLINEQIVRVKHEQEVMRLKPRAMELVDTSEELNNSRKKLREMEFTVATLQKELRKQTLPPTPHAMLDELLSLSNPSLADLLRIKRFILEQERVRAMLVEEMGSSQKNFVTYETTHDELIRRENALNNHLHFLEQEKKKLENQNKELLEGLASLQDQTKALSKRCEASEQEKEHMYVNLAFLTEQGKVQKKKIEELERALLVHHTQMSGFEVASIPAPRQVEKQVMREFLPEVDVNEPYPEEEEEEPEPEVVDPSNPNPTPRPPKPRAPKVEPPRKKKIVYSDALEQTLSSAGSNWPSQRK